MCQQGFIGVLYFRCMSDLEQGLCAAEVILKERDPSYNLRPYIMSCETNPNNLTLFCIDVETTGTLLMFWNLVSAIRHLAGFSSLGEMSCWICIGGDRQIETVMASLEDEEGMN